MGVGCHSQEGHRLHYILVHKFIVAFILSGDNWGLRWGLGWVGVVCEEIEVCCFVRKVYCGCVS